MSTSTPVNAAQLEQLKTDLRSVPVLADLPDDVINWLADHVRPRTFGPGEKLTTEGETADRLMIIIEGHVRGQSETRKDSRIYNAYTGQVTGMLPFSRLKTFPLTVRAMAPTRVAYLAASLFPEMLDKFPIMGERLIGVMSDRIRETTREELQREKLMGLGKLSAGLAHELNNPAAAARRASESLRQAVASVRAAALRLDARALSPEQRVYLAELDCSWNKDHPPTALDSLERSDREEEIHAWLERRGIPEPWTLAPSLVDAGAEVKNLDELATRFEGNVLLDVITRVTASFTVTRLINEIESSTTRISELVRAIKEYSYMDQAPEQEIDIHQGIENTLIMLHHRLKYGVNVKREYDKNIPKIRVFGGELNQVWTNLIENAIDAMDNKGELTIRTRQEFNSAVVEIQDNGPGIPDDIRTRIFEPFFTTKGVGKGTGLGLDVVRRIVEKHKGSIDVKSKPGNTTFRVSIPIQ